MIIGEGDEFEEIEVFVKGMKREWSVPLEVCRNEDVLKAANHTLNTVVKVKNLSERNRAELARIGFDEEAFPFEAESYSGNHLMKTVVFNEFLERNKIKGIFQGLRVDEHPLGSMTIISSIKIQPISYRSIRGSAPSSTSRRRTCGTHTPLSASLTALFMNGVTAPWEPKRPARYPPRVFLPGSRILKTQRSGPAGVRTKNRRWRG